MAGKIRVGIDVGGTFTDAIALDNDTLEIIAKKKVLTTHSHSNGVTQGVIDILKAIIDENNLNPEDVVFIAHGTTQATNALLEGDVASVGILAAGTGIDAKTAKKESNPGNIELAKDVYLPVSHTFVDSSELTDDAITKSIDYLTDNGAKVIVASEAYSVDDPTNEDRILKIATDKGYYATCGHEISELYGLRVRTRTAVINASLIPKMIETANVTEKAIKYSGITSNLMVMRSDGGVMDVGEMRKRPILTMLSGLAAGVAGALMYEKISDGIFLEVGGTSVDISVIKDGRVMLKNAQVGGHKTYMKSLDIHTLGLAGGSMISVEDKKIIDVGPRSAHIANKKYECFESEGSFVPKDVFFISPKEKDPCTYAIVRGEGDEDRALTLAGAANILGYVPAGDYAEGNVAQARIVWEKFADYLGVDVENAARQVMDKAVEKAMTVVSSLISEYELDPSFITLVGGGGSASVLVPAIAEYGKFKFKIAKNAPYISTIGVAMAMVREEIERMVLNPQREDILRIRNDAIEKVVHSGANPATVEVNIEIDAQKNILRATAVGTTEFRTRDITKANVTEDEMKEIVSDAFSVPPEAVSFKACNGRWNVLQSEEEKTSLFGLIKKKETKLAIVDREGVIRHKAANEHYLLFKKGELNTRFESMLDDRTKYSDANATLPRVFLFYGEKMLDLCGMATKSQMLVTIEAEIQFLSDDSDIIATFS